MPELRLIYSDQLVLSELNPRRAAPSEAETAALAGSIRELGLLQNLIGLDVGDHVEIVGGGLRLRALQTLPPQEVEVLVYDDPDAASEAALAENEVRREMTPADRFAAYLALSERGHSSAEIAVPFGVTASEIDKTLALRVCAPEVLAALGEGRINLDQAREFTVTRDHARQVAVLGLVDQTWWDGQIRRKLRAGDEAQEVQRALRFVGLDAYAAAGGPVTRDLFGGGDFVEDATLLFRLRDQQLKAAAEAEEAAGWSWAEVVAGPPLDLETLEPGESADPLTEAEADALAQMESFDEEDLDEEGLAELVALRAKAAREEEGVWSADQMSVGGVAVWLAGNGTLVVVRGLVRFADEARAVELGLLESGQAVEAAAPGTLADPSSPDVLPAGLVADLLGLRSIAIRNVVAASPELALDLLAWHFEAGSSGLLSVSLSAGGVADGATLGIEPVDLDLEKTAASFLAFRLRGKKHRNAVLARAVARAFGSGWGRGAPLASEHVAAAAGVDLRQVWTPDAALFKRMKVGQLEALHRELTGVGLAGGKKGELVAVMTTLFADPRGAVAVLREVDQPQPVHLDAEARIAAWLPAPLRPAEPHAPASGLAA